ncbi:MAG: glycosyltransferase family 4 protein [Candidatus Poseidonia sp.]|nr:glycosyltransferase family 4 protein [Poseidonia sp.]
MAQEGEREGSRPRVLVVRGSFGALGGAERELLQLLRAVEHRWKVTLATLDFPDHARELLGDADVEVVCPERNTVWPQGAWAEISAASSRLSQRLWPSLGIPWESFDAVHLSVCKGTLEILPLIPRGLSVHYHCLEPPRWLYEDVLHRRLDGRPKRPLWLTSLLFTRQRRRDQRFVKALIQRPNATISGNSMWIQRRLKTVYGLASDPMKGNGEPPKRDDYSRPLEATHLMHVIDLEAWPTEASTNELEDLKAAPDPPSPYVMTVGRTSHVKGTWDTLRSLEGTGFGLVQVGGGDAADIAQLQHEAKRLGVPLVCMPRLSQAALVGLVRSAAAMVSHAHHEPFGLTPIEAMAVGTPALMVDEGGFQCTMSGIESGKLLRREDAEGWRAAYQDLNNSELRAAWATVGRPYVESHFTLPVQIAALETLLGLHSP